MPLRDSFQWIKKNYFTFLKTYQKEILLLFIILYPINLFFFLQIQQFKNPTPDMDQMRIVTLLSMAVTEYLIQILRQIFFFTLLYGIYFNKRLHSPIAAILKNFKQVFIECLRCVLPILLKTLLFIVPGIIEYIRLAFVAPVVLFSKDYAADNEDALDASRKWTLGHKTNLLIIYLMYIALAVVSNALIAEALPEGLINHFFVYTAGFFIDIFIYLFIGCYFFAIFPKAQTAFQE
jgi:hypothetical protein